MPTKRNRPSRRLFLGRKLDKYLDPFRFGQLNAFEKILLPVKDRLKQGAMARYVRDKWELITRSRKFDRLFVALKTSALKSRKPVNWLFWTAFNQTMRKA